MNTQRILRRSSMLGLVLAVLTFAVGCTGPRYINSSTGRQNTVKFTYIQKKFLSYEQGIIKCEVGANGALTGCKEMKIVFQEN